MVQALSMIHKAARIEDWMTEAEQCTANFLDALNAHDAGRVREVLSTRFVFEEAAGAGESSMEALEEELRLIYRAFPDIAFRPVRQTSEGSRVLVEFRAFGTHDGEFLNVPATGTLAILSGVFNLECDGERVARLRMTVDFGNLRRQLLIASSRS